MRPDLNETTKQCLSQNKRAINTIFQDTGKHQDPQSICIQKNQGAQRLIVYFSMASFPLSTYSFFMSRLTYLFYCMCVIIQLRIMNNSKQSVSSDSQSEQIAASPSRKVLPKKGKQKNTNKIVINISDCQYPVVSKVAKHFGWRRQPTPDTMDWDICWTDNAVQPETLTKMELYQKINHFPGMYNLARKNLLGRGLMRMRKKFPDQYDFFPLTWMLPVQYHQLKAYFESKAKGKARTFIVKPECLSQGKGIFLTRKLQDINPTAHCVVQRYLHRPYLIDGLKFDFRIYVLVASVDPLALYLYEEGLGRFATQKYEAPNRENMEDICMHLTNYAINKDNPKFVFNESEKDMSKGHKRSLTSVYELLQTHGVDVPKLKEKIKDCIIKTMISGLPHLTSTYRSCQPENYAANMCFELLGFDVMLNDKAEPVILQINHTPSFTTDTPLDHFIKFNYIRDALTIMNINQKTKADIIKQEKQACQLRVMTGKKVKLTQEEREVKKKELIEKKLKYEKKNIGKFQRIYPLQAQEDPYKSYMDYADEMFQISMGSRRVKKVEEVKPASVVKPKTKRPVTLSTTPDLLQRKPIAQRKYETKQNIKINSSECQNREEKSNTNISINKCELRQSIPFKPLSSFEESKPFTSTLKEEKQLFISKTPKDQFKQLLNNYTEKNRFDAQERQFKSLKRINGREEVSEKRIGEKEKLFAMKSSSMKEKIPITLNTLLINGIQQHTNFVAGNLKKYVISKN